MIHARMLTFALISSAALPQAFAQGEAPDEAPPGASGQVEVLAQQARLRYQEGRFSEAVGLYLEAYRLTPASALLYNIALIYDRKLDEPELAIQFYRRYIAAPDADPQVAQRATTRIQQLKAAPPPSASGQVGVLPGEDAKQRGQGGAQIQDEIPPRRDEGRALAGWITAGAGVALVAGGVAFGLSAAQSEDDFADATSLARKQRLRDDGEQQALIADVLTVGGLAAVGVGVWLLLTADATPPEAGGVTVGAGPTADGGFGMWLGGDL